MRYSGRRSLHSAVFTNVGHRHICKDNGGYYLGKAEEANKQQTSLNRDGRKKELMKITMENQQFLKRLQNKKSCYSVSRWEEDFSKKEKLMREVMCEYPFVLDKTPAINNVYQDQTLHSHRQSLNSASGLKEFMDYRSSQEGGLPNL